MSSTRTGVDRAALVRRALVELVAERGFAGTSMAAVAERAGVAAGTIYVHHSSRDDLIMAAYREIKEDLIAAAAAVVHEGPPGDRFRSMWLGIHRHLAADPVRARFLVQTDASPYGAALHAEAAGDLEDELARIAGPELMELLVDLPLRVVYDLGIGPAVRLAAIEPDDDLDLEEVVAACLRAVTRP